METSQKVAALQAVPLSIEPEVIGALRALTNAAANGDTGELIIVEGDLDIHLYLSQGEIAWAFSTEARTTFRDVLLARGVARDVLNDVIEECRKTRSGVISTLINWSVASHEVIAEALMQQTSAALSVVCGTTHPQHLWVPNKMAYEDGHTLTLSALLEYSSDNAPLVWNGLKLALDSSPATTKPSPLPRGTTPPEEMVGDLQLDAVVTQLAALHGCMAVAIIDPVGRVVRSRGELGVDLALVTPDVAAILDAERATINALGLEETVDDILISLADQYHLLRPIVEDQLFVYVVLDRKIATLGIALQKLRAVDVSLRFARTGRIASVDLTGSPNDVA